MKTIITATGNTEDALFDLRYGRAKYFCIYDKETNSSKFIKNEHADAQGGAGTKAAEQTVELGVKQVISGDFGPKAKEILEKFNIQMVVLNDDTSSIKDIINKIK
ncbi:MAG: dinitrogenase iron-molybdenum cofactor biosynthesis protein [Bacteroidales bacterium]|nr:dinitrogenase iron-molybdenum cofactor biosynthesis protein [Bacteroidales bacterium]